MWSAQERGDDTKVAVAASDHPEKVGVFVSVGGDPPSLRQHHIHGEQIVHGEAVPVRQVTVSTPEGQPTDTGGRDGAAHCRQAKRLGGMIYVTPGVATLDPHRACGGIDVPVPHA